MNGDLIPENYNSKVLVAMWGDFINWKKRRTGENNFLINKLHEYGAKRIFDASLGDGCDSVYLLKNGFDVTSNEIDKVFLNKALKNARREGVKIKPTSLDWRRLDSGLKEESFDAVICLGNSLTYLFTKQNQLKALTQFRKILKKGGVLIADERNYQYILDNKREILKGNFRYSGKYVYCGDKVHGKPIEISEKRVRIEYTNERTGKKGYLILYPFRRGELKKLLKEAGFKEIERFSDYKKGEKSNADFYQYVCAK